MRIVYTTSSGNIYPVSQAGNQLFLIVDPVPEFPELLLDVALFHSGLAMIQDGILVFGRPPLDPKVASTWKCSGCGNETWDDARKPNKVEEEPDDE